MWRQVKDSGRKCGDEREESNGLFITFDSRDQVGGVDDVGALVEGLKGVDWKIVASARGAVSRCFDG